MHGLAAFGVIRFLFDLIDHLVTHPVFDELVVLGGHGVGCAADGRVFVEVELAHFQRVFAQSHRNFVHHGFDAEHALRAAEATESGGALHVGLAAVADQLECGQVVSVVDVQASTVVHRARVIGAVTAARHERDVCAQDAAVVIKTHFVVDAEIVTLAGDGHVVVAVDAQLDGFLQLKRRQCSALAEDAGVALFATKAAPHAAANYLHIVGVQVQGVCGFALVAVGVLG